MRSARFMVTPHWVRPDLYRRRGHDTHGSYSRGISHEATGCELLARLPERVCAIPVGDGASLLQGPLVWPVDSCGTTVHLTPNIGSIANFTIDLKDFVNVEVCHRGVDRTSHVPIHTFKGPSRLDERSKPRTYEGRMRIEFFNHAGEKVLATIVETEDYWEACEWGFTQLHTEQLSEAEDFQVYED